MKVYECLWVFMGVCACRSKDIPYMDMDMVYENVGVYGCL